MKWGLVKNKIKKKDWKSLQSKEIFINKEAFKLDDLWKEYRSRYKDIKNYWEEITMDKKHLENQLRKKQKLIKLLYLQHLKAMKGNSASNSSIASLIKKENMDLTEQSSTNRLMISREEHSKKDLLVEK